MNKKYFLIFLLFIIVFPVSLFCQEVYNLLTKIKLEFENQNYYSVLSICRGIEKICEEEPVSECWYTNVMKNVYRYKGLSEFELYKKELKLVRLEASIQSLEISYDLYKDPEILFSYGYLVAIKAVAIKNRTNLEGLVKAWQGILEIYGRDNWIVNKELIERTKDFIKIAEKFSIAQSGSNYSGRFAKYMILLACQLAEKSQLNSTNEDFFNKFKTKYKNKYILGKLTE